MFKLINCFESLNLDDEKNKSLNLSEQCKSINKIGSFEGKTLLKNINKKKKNNSCENIPYLLSLKRNREKNSLENDKEKKFDYIENNNISNKIINDNSDNNYFQKENLKSNDKIKNSLLIDNERNCLKEKANNKNMNALNESKYGEKFDNQKNENLKKNQNDFEYSKIGFKNIGHSCYMNSFLQILLHIPHFLKQLTNLENNNNKNIIYYLIKLSEDPKNSNILKTIKNIMGQMNESYGKYIQNDSQEFGIDLINKIISCVKKDISFNEESEESLAEENIISNINELKFDKFKNYLKKYYPKENEVFLERMFQFHELKIKMKKNNIIKSIDFETFINIDLIFPSDNKNNNFTLEILLKYKYFKQQFLNEDKNSNKKIERNDELLTIKKNDDKNPLTSKEENYWKKILDFFNNCWPFNSSEDSNNDNIDNTDNINIINLENNSNSKIYSENMIIKKIVSLPKILIISINRALLNNPLNSNSLTFDETLNMKNYIDEEIMKDSSANYKLFAINECSGYSKEYGHYYSYIKLNEEWFKFDDNNVGKKKPNFTSQFVVGLYYIKIED